jgi:hypothetical protein
MASPQRAEAAVAAILVREGIDYAQSKAVFKAARQRAGLHAPPPPPTTWSPASAGSAEMMQR